VIQSFSLKLLKGFCLKETGAIDLLYLYNTFLSFICSLCSSAITLSGLAPIASLVIQIMFSWLSIDQK